jgi:predicted metal-dependent phosphoesterase TrpH
MSLCDLHIHSIFSDGTYSPAQVIDISKEQGLSAISITDHDTIKAVPLAKTIGKEQSITVLSGVELSGVYKDIEIHVLGYLFDEDAVHLGKKLLEMRQHRETRAQKIVEKLEDEGFRITFDDVKKVAGNGAIGRPHIARALLERKCIVDYKEAFTRYIGNGKPCNVPKLRLCPEEAIQLIADAHGISVLAHPGNIGDEVVVRELLNFPFQGIEVWHPDHSSNQVMLYKQLAQQKGMLMTGGSDSHGEKRTKAAIGEIEVDAKFAEALIEYKKAYL